MSPEKSLVVVIEQPPPPMLDAYGRIIAACRKARIPVCDRVPHAASSDLEYRVSHRLVKIEFAYNQTDHLRVQQALREFLTERERTLVLCVSADVIEYWADQAHGWEERSGQILIVNADSDFVALPYLPYLKENKTPVKEPTSEVSIARKIRLLIRKFGNAAVVVVAILGIFGAGYGTATWVERNLCQYSLRDSESRVRSLANQVDQAESTRKAEGATHLAEMGAMETKFADLKAKADSAERRVRELEVCSDLCDLLLLYDELRVDGETLSQEDYNLTLSRFDKACDMLVDSKQVSIVKRLARVREIYIREKERRLVLIVRGEGAP